MLVYLAFALQVAAGQPNSQPAMQAQPLIWRDFRVGMTPEQFADGLRRVDGIKSVEVKRKGTKPAKLKIAYSVANSVQIGDLNVAITPSFIDDRLNSVNLSETQCFSAAEAKVPKLIAALSEKYPQQQRVTIVDDDGVQVETQLGLYNQETRVTLSVSSIENPYPHHVYGGSGFLAAANNLANTLADNSYNSAIEACPLDNGRKATLQLDYVSQERFKLNHDKESADRAARAKKTADGL